MDTSLHAVLNRFAHDNSLNLSSDTYHDVRWYRLEWLRNGKANAIEVWEMQDGLHLYSKVGGRDSHLRGAVRDHPVLFLLDWVWPIKDSVKTVAGRVLPYSVSPEAFLQNLEDARNRLNAQSP